MTEIIELLTKESNNWIAVITGSGGALVVLMMWVKYLISLNKEKDKEIREISRLSVECITKILEKIEQDREWKKDLDYKIDYVYSALMLSNRKEQ